MAQEHIIRFKDSHDLGLDIYDASDASLRYSNTFTGSHTREYENEPRDLAPSKKPGDEEDMKARMGTYPIFAGPVRLSWHDFSDKTIEYTFDFNDIFPDKTIPHPKELEDRIIWENPFFLSRTPGIILEIIDRTLNIYAIVDIGLLKIGTTDEVESITYHEKVFTKEF